MSSSLPERLGIPGDDLLFNALHGYKDQFHGGGELELLAKYGTDPRIQREMLWAAKTAVETFALMFGEIERLALEAVEGHPPSRRDFHPPSWATIRPAPAARGDPSASR